MHYLGRRTRQTFFQRGQTANRYGKRCLTSQGGYRKGRGISDQIANIHWIIEKTKEFQKNIYYTKAFDGVDHNKLWKILKEMGILTLLFGILKKASAKRLVHSSTMRKRGNSETSQISI